MSARRPGTAWVVLAVVLCLAGLRLPLVGLAGALQALFEPAEPHRLADEVIHASRETAITLPVALGNFLSADDSPWELLMTAGFIYALPPAAIYYAFKRYMVAGLTAGAVKS